MKRAVLAMALFISVATTAWAESCAEKQIHFKKISLEEFDYNKDGVVNREEFRAKLGKEGRNARFDEVDSNHNNIIEPSESDGLPSTIECNKPSVSETQ